jgi:orotidine-5'-phosphate decarboxylase
VFSVAPWLLNCAENNHKDTEKALSQILGQAGLNSKLRKEKIELTTNEKLIIALDVDTPTKALDLVRQLHSVTGMFKVGSQLFTSAGPQIVRDIIALDTKVFLDLKFHDIPHQVAGAARAAAELGVSLFTIHASGGSEMMQRAVESVTEVAERNGGVRAKVLAISVLTSVDAQLLSQIGVISTPAEAVLRLVKLAESSGVDGVVASPQEVETIRRAIPNPAFLVVTPGIRPSRNEPASAREDQKRVATPETAIAAGASYLVVGRPITEAQNPLEAAREIVAQMERIKVSPRNGTD